MNGNVIHQIVSIQIKFDLRLTDRHPSSYRLLVMMIEMDRCCYGDYYSVLRAPPTQSPDSPVSRYQITVRPAAIYQLRIPEIAPDLGTAL